MRRALVVVWTYLRLGVMNEMQYRANFFIALFQSVLQVGVGLAVLADGETITLQVPKSETSQATAKLLAEHEVTDLTVEDPPIEDVIEQVFASVAPA